MAAVYVSSDSQHELLDRAILAVKSGGPSDGAVALARLAADELRADSVDVIVAACSELPLLFDRIDGAPPIVDATDCLARATVAAAFV